MGSLSASVRGIARWRCLFTAVALTFVAACGRQTTVVSSNPPGEGGATPAPRVLPVSVSGSELIVTRPDGTTVRGAGLVGATLVVDTERGTFPVRIDSVAPDRLDRAGETLVYDVSVVGPDGGTAPFCEVDPWGDHLAIPIAGSWDKAGGHQPVDGHFELMCTAGAIAKCVRFGYKPWKGPDAWAIHQACTRAVRADYCGDGTAHTKTGTLIDIFDREGIQRDEPGEGLTFEAAFSPTGAACVARTRIPSIFSLDALRAQCPGALGPGGACSEATAKENARALVFIRSR
jgi:hypothetical protein